MLQKFNVLDLVVANVSFFIYLFLYVFLLFNVDFIRKKEFLVIFLFFMFPFFYLFMVLC